MLSSRKIKHNANLALRQQTSTVPDWPYRTLGMGKPARAWGYIDGAGRSAGTSLLKQPMELTTFGVDSIDTIDWQLATR